ncbi:hypothetical protein D9619_009868 [Psilocybe cf. subviscida]|uniref:SUZ domain-containing protein n=1 Tax=Psilocybe cf. subviscida TaxID=2480587 RepID=A0A8H5BN74_9AGAR|nr:hypothetical protein D9619_009868 [Psilocybe cf. subviscida]
MSRPTDSWDDTPSQSGSAPFASGSAAAYSTKKPKISVVRDDWEMDDDDEADTMTPIAVEEQNKRIWEDANTKPQHPMPKVVMSRGASAPVTSPSLPLNQPPPMRILKRPSATPAQVKQIASPGESFQEREARYQAARERIFGTSSPDAAGATTPKDTQKKASGSASPSSGPQVSPATKVIRDPRGPPNQSSVASDSRGFGERTAQKPPMTANIPQIHDANPTMT